MEKNGELIQEFCAITACRPEEASFHLESCNWNLDSALHSFFENSELAADRVLEPRRLEDQEQEEEVEVAEVAAPGNPNPPLMASESKSRRNKKPSTSRAAGITTLSDIQRGAASSGSDSDSDGPQEYYTGGEKSGMLVQDPSRRGGPDVNDIFERARQLGATEEPPPEEDRSSRPRAFTGTARLLSGETVPTAPEPQVPQTVSHTITFWRNGFTVDDGPLRTLDDPANASFLESIGRHQCPQELQPSDFRTQVEIRLARRMDEDCVVQTPKLVPFQGVGRTLGSSSSCAAAEPSSSTSIAATSSVSSKEFSVDDSKPVTSVQVRLADGTRMVARFNHHHTVADIQAFINAARPGGASHYQLQAMGFPPRLLNDPAETIEKAGLLNSVVIQKL